MDETRQKYKEIDIRFAQKIQELPPEWFLEVGCWCREGLVFSAEASLLLYLNTLGLRSENHLDLASLNAKIFLL